VEDNPALCALTEEILSSAGYSILAARDGAHALRVAEQYAGPIQLLLTDITLPKESGTDIAALLTALRPEMKVLFMSGHGQAEMTRNGTLRDGAQFIQKPWSARGLCQKIDTLLAVQAPAYRILVVDDEAGVRDWLAETLAASGHHVITARDGLEAKRLAVSQHFDLLITDISMPNEEGLGTIRALKKAHPGLKIIAISGAYPEALGDAKLLGASAALMKPFTAEILLKCIRDLWPAANNG